MGPPNKPVMISLKRECGLLGVSCGTCRWAVGWSQSGEYGICIKNPVHMNTHREHFCAQHNKKSGA